jgi:hypothetical protein
MTRLSPALAAITLLLVASPALANPYPVYFERQRGTTVTLEHTPVPPGIAVAAVRRTTVTRTKRVSRPKAAVRRVARRTTIQRVQRYTGIAGGCRDGGYVRRAVAGRDLVLQREVCHNIEIRLTGPYVVR